ncbi:Ankyrin-2 (ANK-2) (Ankyrin-B) (Brain ankyrin) [Durusdinium trenchii]|uniref:Ankyrin-2 (ANK-2) (Ankyrin-B) (Brain ankyrin) n=1 Tax=Durusdinium trenchii TaxID=1381693 RepID=A0ABP0SPD5_9DINO
MPKPTLTGLALAQFWSRQQAEELLFNRAFSGEPGEEEAEEGSHLEETCVFWHCVVKQGSRAAGLVRGYRSGACLAGRSGSEAEPVVQECRKKATLTRTVGHLPERTQNCWRWAVHVGSVRHAMVDLDAWPSFFEDRHDAAELSTCLPGLGVPTHFIFDGVSLGVRASVDGAEELATKVRIAVGELAVFAGENLGEIAVEGPADKQASSAVNACTRASEWWTALQLANDIFLGEKGLRRLRPDRIAITALLSACDKGGQWALVLELLEDGDSLDTTSLSIAMNALTHHGQWQRACNLFHQAKDLDRDLRSYTALVHACGEGAQWESACGLLEEVSMPDTVMFNAVIAACSWDVAIGLIQKMKAVGCKMNCLTFGALTSSAASSKQWTVALSTLLEMHSKGIEADFMWKKTMASFDSSTWPKALKLLPLAESYGTEGVQWLSSHVQALESAGRRLPWEKALAFLEEPATWGSSLPSLEAFNAVIHLFEKAGAWDAALRAFSTMQDFSVEPNRVRRAVELTSSRVSVNSVISACEKSRRWRWALKLLQELLEDGNADEVSYNAAISALEKSGQWQYTLLLLEQMLSPDQNEVLPDQVSFNAAIGACAKEEHWEGALSLFALMQSRQIQADEITYNCLASACEADRWQFSLFFLLNSTGVERVERGELPTRISQILWRCAKLKRLGHPSQDVASQAAELLKLVDPGDFQLQALASTLWSLRSAPWTVALRSELRRRLRSGPLRGARQAHGELRRLGLRHLATLGQVLAAEHDTKAEELDLLRKEMAWRMETFPMESMSDVALKDLATAALALLYATECAVSGAVSSAVSGGRLRVALSGRTKTRSALLLPRGRRAMLRLVWATSGDPVCTLDADELQWLEEHHNSVRALKELLASPTRLHVTRFRLRLMLQGCFQVLSDSEILSLPQNLELVLLELLPPKVTHTERLIGACMQNRVHRVETLLQLPQDPNDQDEEGRRPLHFAAAAGHVRCVNLLLEAKASQEPASDNLGRACPLHFAAGQGHLEVVRVLLAAGAEKDQETDGGATPLHVACEEGYADVVRHLIECGADKDKARSDDGATPLLLASLEGHLEVVRTLLEVDVDKEKATSDTGTTPLHEAVRHNRREVMQLLLERRADADRMTMQHGLTPLHIAVQEGHHEGIGLLLDFGAEKDKPCRDVGAPPLLHAVALNQLPIVKVLLERRAQIDKSAENVGIAPLHVAAERGSVPITRLLLEFGADRDSSSAAGEVPLHFAASQGHLEVSRLLLEAGAQKESATRELGITPLHRAAQEGHLEVVRLLLSAGAAKDKAILSDGATPLLFAAIRGHMEVCRLLLGANAPIDQATSDRGSTPLHMAAQEGHVELVRFLVASGADKDLARTDDGTTPLLLGVLQGHLEVARVLLELGVETDKATTDDGTTALHLAVRQYDLHMVQLLLDFGARPDVTNALGDRPLDVALRYEDQDMVDLLSSSVHPKRRKLCPRSTGRLGQLLDQRAATTAQPAPMLSAASSPSSAGMLGALAPQVLWHGGSCLVLWKPPHWQVDEREPKEEVETDHP